ncbi:MAG: imidazoleglycerol-phosphate dehydratase HisB [SAR202 cluster bacterium]|jgi:imidazoleglycerol-phosphate dehydratase|nr:imidazoleglycerol-phosphate dehydratase HisB [Dehalococcoidia bacterium]MDP7627173.1 imidazoleglycerol-phosphate dehydratase HisB [SAR202 cluster bacterium]MQG02815.1 imidazoleglycerol-phosphate dehydratase HisB [SAR202 cluster bacterium]HAE33440.1 imidazoleglycerol-phosphate dehydratase HisB [Dehalococcoidia bacterium]|tara:strand:- start:376 stop:972 length:597 start_codon:yes stop_codon:yes gene_type:complete
MKRVSQSARETQETKISVSVCLDGSGKYEIQTGNGMFDHLLAQIARHGLIDLTILAEGDIQVGWHHIVEDTAIVLGKAFKEAVSDGAGIVRMGHSYVPLDEALVLTVVDYSGRGYSVIDAPMTESDLGGLPADLIRHFMETLSREGGFNLHVRVLAGMNNHHIAEATFKSLARSLKAALSNDPRQEGAIASTKGTISQ